MKKIAFVIPYYGKFPSYYWLWLKTCEKNPTVDFFVITDIKDNLVYPNNVKKVEMSFEELRQVVQKKFEFPISLDRPYKLCDYKPAYGDIFEDMLKEYDYVGHCDIDLFFGDIRKYITDEVLDKNVRFFSQGHCSLYRNNEYGKTLYKTLDRKGRLDWKEVYQSNKNWCFDEWAGHCGGGISSIMEANNIPMYNKHVDADIDPGKREFEGAGVIEGSYFEYDNGKVYMINNDSRKEVLLAHFQKRDIRIDHNLDTNHFYLISPYFVTSNPSLINKNNELEKIKYQISFWYKTIKRKIERDLLNKY